MDTEAANVGTQNGQTLPETDNLDEALILITSQPKRQHTQEEIDEARGNLAP